MKNLTPMMRQYFDIKEKYKDCILFFRLGDFYEMFFDDAITASKELQITLTGRDCGEKERAPMCGVPHHAAENYIAKLIQKGYKVAICEQTEDPAEAKGIVKRDVIRVITPGTVLSENMLNEKDNNYIVCLFKDEDSIGLAYTDLSTGELKACEIPGKDSESKIIHELVKIDPKEIILNKMDNDFIKNQIGTFVHIYTEELEDWYFKKDRTKGKILNHFQIASMKGIGLEDRDVATRALGALLIYLSETQKNTVSHLNRLHVYEIDDHMMMDKATLKNLELIETVMDKRVQGSLLGILDKTHTAMGGRKLKQWIKEPLNDMEKIKKRLDSVELFIQEDILRNNLKTYLKEVYDLERLIGKVACKTANARDLLALHASLSVLPDIKESITGLPSLLIDEIDARISNHTPICENIEKAFLEDPPYTIKEGGLIKDGFSEELDELKASIYDGKKWIANLEDDQKQKTGIKSLKVGFNKVFGYYIEVTKSYYDLVPENYIRKQTLVNCERFITSELKEVESKVLNAEAKINELEYKLFIEIRDEIEGFVDSIQQTSEALSELDVLLSYATVSCELGYVKPTVNDSDTIMIKRGRHTVVENLMENGIFVANDTWIDSKDNSFLLITGPNMAGKSTYMRQTALIVLMAQIGCFVPCEEASIGIVDRIFTRIGAFDNLAQGQSTFLVEMSELAYILNTATPKSLIILDEIGRGTSTYDGLSIAWAVVEYLCNDEKKIKTLFATHYHELTTIEGQIKGVKNLSVDVKEDKDDIIFLHKIVEGSANQSYGIQVAKLAGVPTELLENAKNKLSLLENEEKKALNYSSSQPDTKDKAEEQISLFNHEHYALHYSIIEQLRNINLYHTTPMEAMKILEELIKKTGE
ncbi:MAG: DNA mismatch repair protein MutS [Peptostreptococcales bacterium]